MKYQGGCHCGRVRYEVDFEIQNGLSCNCSICQKRGALLAFVPDRQFTLLSGENDLIDYQFAKKVIHHLFCKVCGVGSFAKGRDGQKMMYAINLRCLDNVDLDKVPVVKYDGRSL